MKIVAFSDNHSDWNFEVPNGNVLICAGDFSYMGNPAEIQDFIGWLNEQPHKHKLWIAGNHELGIENFPHNAEAIDNKTGATYIHDKVIEIEGLKFFGCNFTPEFNNWAFNLTERQSKIFWENAPEADVVVCHGPPYGYCDSVTPEYPVERPLGCLYFLEHIKRTKPLLVIVGHIHGSFSQQKVMKHENGKETLVANVSVMNEDYTVVAPATVFTIDENN